MNVNVNCEIMESHPKKLEFLGKLYINLKRSDAAYKQYLANNKQFLYARILKSCNDGILRLLVDNTYLLSDELIEDSLGLILHLDVWSEKWTYYEAMQKPKIDDVFAFENEITFPHKAVQNLINEFLSLRSR